MPSDSSFDPVTILTNSKVRMVEVSDGVYMQGKELEEYCLKRGKCPKCAKVKVRRKIVKVFGSNTWEPITSVKVPVKNNSKSKSNSPEKGRRIKNKAESYNTVKKRIDSGNDDDVEYLVYNGYCLSKGCYTLDQAKRLSGISKSGIGGGDPSRRNSSSSVDSSNKSLPSIANTNSSTSKQRGKIFGKGFLRRSSKSGTAANPNNPFFTPPKNDKHPLLKVGEDSPVQTGMMLSPLSTVGVPTTTALPTDEVSSTGEVSSLVEHDNYHPRYDNNHSSVVPSPQVRKEYEHEFSQGSPKRRYHSNDLYAIGSYEIEEAIAAEEEEEQPMREVVQVTLSSLQSLSAQPAIRTLDLTGLRFRLSEMEALAKMFKAGKNGTVHLTSLVLDNCGIDDRLLGILGQSLYDALWTANNTIGTKSNHSNSDTAATVDKSMRHARMRLKSLYLGDNDFGNQGIEGLCPYLDSISCELENLDLSRNRIEARGGIAIFDALKRNPQTKIQSIDLSYNLLRELDNDAPISGGNQAQLYSSYSPNSVFSGQSSGIRGFLSKNKTLKELDLSANRMTDEWVESICDGLSGNNRTVLEKLNLGFNRIGDKGAVAIGNCLRDNQSLVFLELNDNQIGNDGGQVLLSAMEDNITLQDISGLWSNKIDKRHIIVSIRQLLVSDTREAKKQHNNDPSNPHAGGNNYHDDSDDSDVDIYITSGSESTLQTRNATGKDRLLLDEEDTKSLPRGETPIGEENKNVRKFYAADDHGSLSDLSDQEDDLSDSFDRLLQDNGDENDLEAIDGLMETNQEVTHNIFDRMTIMNGSPLVCFDNKENGTRRGIPLLDTMHEAEAIKSAVEAHHLPTGSHIEVREEIATLDKFKAFFSTRDSSVLHLSCHGFQDGLALEDGYGSLEKLPLSSLKELVSSGARQTLQLVFVSSPCALKIGRAFLDAGVKRVVCCRRNDAFKDPLALKFMESFYEHASQKKTLLEAFEAALRTVVSSPISKNSCLVTSRFHLLPFRSSYNSSPIFFQRFLPNKTHHDNENENEYDQFQEQYENDSNQVLPQLPDAFLGREVEIFKILESLQVANCVEISGNPKIGKNCVVGASLEYALKRNETFSIDQVCWIPSPEKAMVDPDSLYGDLILCYDLIRESDEDLWDRSEEILDCRERLAIELEGAKVVVVIDNRDFSSRGSRASLEKLVNFIVTYTSSVKVVCISATKTYEAETPDYSAIKTCRIEIGALPFRSTARLFGESSKHVSRSNNFMIAESAKEFSELADLPFVSSHTNDFSSDANATKRRTQIFERIGNGIPAQVIASAKDMSGNSFQELMEVILKPEICIDSLSRLESEVRRWNIFMDLSIKDRNYKRAMDLQATIVELDDMRIQFSSLKDLKAKEKAMKSELADAVSNRRYDVANELKKDLLALKKKIMKERRVPTNRSVENPEGVLSDLKAQVDSLADAIEQDENLVLNEKTKSFDMDCDGHTCTFLIYSGNIFEAKNLPSISDPNKQCESEAIGIVCWSNEACDLEASFDGKSLLELETAEKFKECVANLPVLEETQHGSVRCLMGNSVILDPRSSSSMVGMGSNKQEAIVAMLTVGPFASTSGQIDALLERDKEYHRFSITTLQSCYRSCVRQAHQANLQSLAICPMTTRTKNGPLYEETLKVAVREIVEEVKFSPGLREVRLVGKTPKEAALFAQILKTIGFFL